MLIYIYIHEAKFLSMMIHRVTQSSNVSFAANKPIPTQVFLDLVGTSIPYPMDKIVDPRNTEYDKRFSQMQAKIRGFFQVAREKVQLFITTGNQKSDFDDFLGRIAKKGLEFCMPVNSKLITNYGGDTFKKVSSREFVTSRKKIRQVEKDSGWVKSEVVKDLKMILANVCPETSIFKFGDNKELREVIFEQKKDNYACLQEDESNFKVSLIFPEKAETGNLVKALKKHFNEATNMKVKVETSLLHDLEAFAYSEKGELAFCKARAVVLRPEVDEGASLTKLYDPKIEVKKNQGLVIVAGNGPGDGPMLNIINYLDKSKREQVKVIDIEDYRKYLQDEEICKQLKEMPLISIVVGDDPGLDSVRGIGKILAEKGIHKVITINNPEEELLPAIKQAMRNYAQENPEYKKDLGEELSKEILGEKALSPTYFAQLLIEDKTLVEAHK